MQNDKNDPLPNSYLYQGKELLAEGSIRLYAFHARQYDPQIGRFLSVDPMDQFPGGSDTGDGRSFINGGFGLGFGAGFSLEYQYQYTPGYGPLWQWKKIIDYAL